MKPILTIAVQGTRAALARVVVRLTNGVQRTVPALARISVPWWKSGRAATTLLARRRPLLKPGEVHRDVLPRGLPGSAIVWSPPRCWMVVPAQWRARHAPVSGVPVCLGEVADAVAGAGCRQLRPSGTPGRALRPSVARAARSRGGKVEGLRPRCSRAGGLL